MAIQMRRGRQVDFNPNKMLEGEWAVSIDPETEKQWVWMCFGVGIVKRMGTWDDYKALLDADMKPRIDYMDEKAEEVQGHATQAKESEENSYRSETNAKTSETNAKTSETNAEQSKNNALQSEKMSKSYAVGNAGVRTGENTDNSKYYSERSKASADVSYSYMGKVQEEGERMIQAIRGEIDIDTPNWQIDVTDGHIYYEGGRFNWQVQNGRLMWAIMV